jgi:hypothetical protein
MTGGLHLSHSLEVWIGALLTLMVLSFLYRDNPLYKLAEHIFVGATAAYAMALGFWTTLWPNGIARLVPAAARVTDPGAAAGHPDLAVLIPLGLGLLMLCRLQPRLAWLSGWPTAFAIGTSAGYNVVRVLRSDFLAQIESGIRPGLLVRGAGGWDIGASLSAILILAGTVCGLVYFIYTREHRGALGRMARIGILFMMITFGTTFGYTVMSRVALLVSRFRFLLGSWLGLI